MRDEAQGYAAQGCTSPVADLYVGGKSFDVAKEGLAMVAAMKQKPALLQSRIRPTASGRRVQGDGCRFRVGSANSLPEAEVIRATSACLGTRNVGCAFIGCAKSIGGDGSGPT